MKVLITGASGFLGFHIAQQLLAAGHQVTNFSRSQAQKLEEIGIPTIQGNIANFAEVLAASKGQDAIIHTAGKVAMWGMWKDFYSTNVLGTENIVKACQQNNIKFLVYTSSPSAVYRWPGIENGSENLPLNKSSISSYAKTKAMAEEIVTASNSSTLKAVSLRPHLIFGPHEQNLIPGIVNAAKNNRFKKIGDGNNLVDVIYVENAAKAHLQALNKLVQGAPVHGKAYFLGQGPIKLWDFIAELLKLADAPLPKKSLSLKQAYILGLLVETVLRALRIFNVNPPMTRFLALQLGTHHYFSHASAVEDLGFYPEISIEAGLKITMKSYRK